MFSSTGCDLWLWLVSGEIYEKFQGISTVAPTGKLISCIDQCFSRCCHHLSIKNRTTVTSALASQTFADLQSYLSLILYFFVETDKIGAVCFSRKLWCLIEPLTQFPRPGGVHGVAATSGYSSLSCTFLQQLLLILLVFEQSPAILPYPQSL